MKFFKPGPLLVIAVLFFTACKLDKPILPGQKGYVAVIPPGGDTTGTGIGTGTGQGTGTPSGYYFKGTLGGQALNWQVTDNVTGWADGSSSNTSNDQGVITGSLTALISNLNSSFQPKIGVEFRTYQVNEADDNTTYFNSFVGTGPWAFTATDVFTAGAKSVTIYYTDAQGNQYSSIGVQAGTVNVASVSQIPPQPGVYQSLKIKLTFSCTLYPVSGTGGNLTLSNGEATVNLQDLLD